MRDMLWLFAKRATGALRRDGTTDWACVRHEQAGSFAVNAEAAVTRKLAVCVASCGMASVAA